MNWLVKEAKIKIVKKERGKRRWCVITSEGMQKNFASQTEARKYARRLKFWKREVDFSITKRNTPWLKYFAPK